MVMKSKKELRKEILQLRDNISEAKRREMSEKITKRLLEFSVFQNAKRILAFSSYKSEVYTSEIVQKALEMGKMVYMPKVEHNENTGMDEMEFYQIFSESDLEDGYKGIREPKGNQEFKEKSLVPNDVKQEKEIIFMILPGAVFDIEGNRIGYGGGFYDRYIERMEKQLEEIGTVTLYKTALAFQCQIVEPKLIPSEGHDKPLDTIVTEENLYLCNEKYAFLRR